MPYVKIDERDEFYPKAKTANFPGQLNYQITSLVIQYMQKHGLKYQNINDVLGALEGAKMEFYSRVARPYESIKIQENGDLYD